ncbi:hypothetical protein Tsubulata_013284 [Turnera subulata]|uniref:DNA helicase n=1 Tax=Turnera subulata TaxID=218843 RepID=A0A9Q0G539_9ROSI|nr:hypothetical protein Tsubulata_013284 [Turnera subulata]
MLQFYRIPSDRKQERALSKYLPPRFSSKPDFHLKHSLIPLISVPPENQKTYNSLATFDFVLQFSSITPQHQCRGGGNRLRIVFRAERGYRNASSRRMRYNGFVSRVSRLCSRSKHKLAGNLLGEVVKYESDQWKLLSKVSVLMGYDGAHDFIEDEKSGKQRGGNRKGVAGDFDASWASMKFPSIILGSSPPVDLYAESAYGLEEKIVSSVVEWVGPDAIGEQWPSGDALPNINSSVSLETRDGVPGEGITFPLKETKEHTHNFPSNSEKILETGHKVGHTEETSTKVGLEAQPYSAYLDSSINCIPKLTKRQCSQLEDCGFHTVRKLLNHFPRTYADLRNAHVGVEDGQYMISVGKILSSRGVRANYSLSFLEVVLGCEILDSESQHGAKKTIYLHLKKFFRGARFTYVPFLKSIEAKYELGALACVSGKVRTMRMKDHFEMREYNIDVLEDNGETSVHAEGRPYPIYPSKGGLNPDVLRNFVARALQGLDADVDPIPKEIIKDFGLLSLHDAYHGIHQPKTVDEADLARKRLIFDEFFYIQSLSTRVEKDGLLDKYRNPNRSVAHMDHWSSLTKKFLKALPYSLTSSQLTAVSEIIWDLKRLVPMNRLLQGDVGCGKTVVAFLACMEVVGSGYQDLQTGGIDMIIGTHSLISESTEFSALRIAVVDEQHRFGVIQRGRFNSKLFNRSIGSTAAAAAETDGSSSEVDIDMAPHILAMSATPIPRTLALALYGDMSLTQITDLPPGRIPVETLAIEETDDGFENVYKMMLDELENGGKIYLVYPVIEQSEQLPQLRAASADLEVISHRFQGYDCGLLHGKMKSDDKDEALRRFRSGETKILLSTQVIEIGVDVPDASMMIVMNADRFGIAQLHQLRGRVGRGTRKSKCLLIASTSGSLNRLKVLEKSSDGFYLANMDLLMRGPGDLLGKKQSGHLPEFPIARLEIDGNILQDAHTAALKTLGDSHDLERFPALKRELSMRQPLCFLGD